MAYRFVDMINHLPDHIREIEEFRQMCSAEDKEIQLLWDRISYFTTNMDINSMNADMCSRWERFFEIDENSNMTLEERRQRIKGYFASNLPYTEKKLISTLSQMCGEDGYQLLIDSENYKVSIDIRLASMFVESNVREVVRKMIPAHLMLDVLVAYNKYINFISVKYRTMSDYTWNQMRIERLFEHIYNKYYDVEKYKHGELAEFTHSNILNDEM